MMTKLPAITKWIAFQVIILERKSKRNGSFLYNFIHSKCIIEDFNNLVQCVSEIYHLNLKRFFLVVHYTLIVYILTLKRFIWHIDLNLVQCSTFIVHRSHKQQLTEEYNCGRMSNGMNWSTHGTSYIFFLHRIIIFHQWNDLRRKKERKVLFTIIILKCV